MAAAAIGELAGSPPTDSTYSAAVAAASVAVAAAAAVVSPIPRPLSVSANVYRLSTIATF